MYRAMTTLWPPYKCQSKHYQPAAWCNLISRLNALVERSSKFVYSTQRLSNYQLSSVRRDYIARGWQQSFRQYRLYVLYDDVVLLTKYIVGAPNNCRTLKIPTFIIQKILSNLLKTLTRYIFITIEGYKYIGF